MLNNYPEVKQFIENISADYQNIFCEDLVAIYVTGSLSTNSYVEGLSDIDLIVVVKEKITQSDLAVLRNWAKNLSVNDPRAAILDISIVESKNVRFDLPEHPDALEFWKGEFDYAKNALGNSPIVWDQIIKGGITVFGSKPQEIITTVPWGAIQTAIKDEVLTIQQRIDTHFEEIKFRYYVLSTLCRILYTTKNKSYVSKKEALVWYLNTYNLHTKLIQTALHYIEHDKEWATNDERIEYKKFVEEVLNAL
jgi:predicted nucleotidyltransferase